MSASRFFDVNQTAGREYIAHWRNTNRDSEVFPGNAELLARLLTLRICYLTPEQIIEAFKTGQKRQLLVTVEA